MQKSSIYVGIVIVSEDGGVRQVDYHDLGPSWHNLEYAAVVGMERALLPLAPKLAELGMEASKIMLGVGEIRAKEEASANAPKKDNSDR